MGQATLDLPDPLETPTPAGSLKEGAAGADELLSRLAGEEIDRLLAEADLTPGPEGGTAADHGRTGERVADRPGAASGPAATAPPEARRAAAEVSRGEPGADSVLHGELDDLLAGVGEPPAPVESRDPFAAEPAPEPAATDLQPAESHVMADAGATGSSPLVAAELDQVFEQMTGREPAKSAGQPAENAGQPAVGPTPDAPIPPEPTPAEAPPASDDLAKVLGPIIARDAAAEAAADAGAASPGGPGDGAAGPAARPLYRRLVSRILNRALNLFAVGAMIPQPLLDAAGKVAILTLINAVLVLLYVLFIRRR